MKIRTRVWMIIMIPVLFGISVSALQQWMAARVDDALAYDKLVSEITQNTSSLYGWSENLEFSFTRHPNSNIRQISLSFIRE